MGTLQAYFSFNGLCICGIPRVTLEGQRSDYLTILDRVEKLSNFGSTDLSRWSDLLKPIISRFIRAFDGEPDISFWNTICHHNAVMCGGNNYSGWLTAFCAFNDRGKWQLYDAWGSNKLEGLELDGIKYQSMGDTAITWGFCSVDIKINNIDHSFVAGLMGERIKTTSSWSFLQKSSSISAYSAWFIYEKTEANTMIVNLEEAIAKIRKEIAALEKAVLEEDNEDEFIPPVTTPQTSKSTYWSSVSSFPRNQLRHSAPDETVGRRG